jgi:hypothetical protein
MTTMKLKSRETGYFPKMDIIEVGDVPGHIIFVGEQAGVASVEDGSVAVTSAKFMGDMINGIGRSQGYWLGTYEDGSTQWAKYQTPITVDTDGKTGRWEGTFEYINGTGRFEGIQGSGSFTGKRFAPSPGAGAQYLVDNTFTYTLPSK